MSSQRATGRGCAVCGKAIAKHRPRNTKYCDAQCRYKAEYNKRVAGREPLLTDCAWCGVTFDARSSTGGQPMRFCAAKCRQLAKNKRRADRNPESQRKAERTCPDCGKPVERVLAQRCIACAEERHRMLRRGYSRTQRKAKRPTAFTVTSKPVESYDVRKHDRRSKTTRADIDSWITTTGNRKLPADPLEALRVVLAEHEDFREAFAYVNGI